jgi:hypothetical protein
MLRYLVLLKVILSLGAAQVYSVISLADAFRNDHRM